MPFHAESITVKKGRELIAHTKKPNTGKCLSVFDVKFLSVINFILMKEKRKEYKGVDIDRGCIIRQDFSDRGITSFR